tara:strand:- start:223 stop:594 length:372 start_codon:yes stop_codon:yes gene_type:complete
VARWVDLIMSDKQTTISQLKSLIDSFVDERDWQQFHSPKNLSMSISIESSELMELFQWLSLEEAKEVMKAGETRENAIDEIADIIIYAIAFCNRNNIDISNAIKQKMEKNKKKYPADKFKGHF